MDIIVNYFEIEYRPKTNETDNDIWTISAKSANMFDNALGLFGVVKKKLVKITDIIIIIECYYKEIVRWKPLEMAAI